MRRVLLATDGSTLAQNAARFLAHLPHTQKLELTVVSVLTPPYNPTATLRTDWVDRCLEQDRERANEAFEETHRLFEGANASIDHVVINGHAGERICELADSRKCDLVILGAKGRSTVTRMLLGSTSDYVATHATCSVLVVRPIDPARSSHPLRLEVGYELSTPAESALLEISDIHWGPQVELHLVSVAYGIGLLSLSDLEWMRKNLSEAADQLRGNGFQAESHLVENDHLGEGLVKYAEDHQCDLVVVGETQRDRLGRFLMGSTSRYVLRHAPCSVWISRSRVEKESDRNNQRAHEVASKV